MASSAISHDDNSTNLSSFPLLDEHDDAFLDIANTSSHSTNIPDVAPLNVHKRAVPGGIFARLGFLRSAEHNEQVKPREELAAAPKSKISIDDEDDPSRRTYIGSTLGSSAKSSSVRQRRRKGSLRKSALLGGKLFAQEGRDRRNSLLGRGQAKTASSDTSERSLSGLGTADSRLSSDSQRFDTDTGYAASVSSTSLASDPSTMAEARLSLLTRGQDSGTTGKVDTSSATLSSPSDHKSPEDYTSTTEDDEDVLSFARSPKTIISLAPGDSGYLPPDSTATSYFESAPPHLRARPSQQLRPSPLQNAYAPAPEPYSYVETEYWGWVILLVTWLLFTVGMGSALDIWSWAWDVGQTPYAPPELEDDPTLPIVGYYPALIVLTGVVAWVWITVAWVGMKYFRHAKIEV